MDSAWDIFNAAFSVGDHLIMITDEDEIVQGEMIECTETYGMLKTSKMKITIPWIHVRFCSHIGFPVAECCGADGHISIEKEKNVAEDLRSMLQGSVRNKNCGVSLTTRFGDPFDITEPVKAFIFHPRILTYGGEFEEGIKLQAKDGAIGLLYHLESVYFAEVA